MKSNFQAYLRSVHRSLILHILSFYNSFLTLIVKMAFRYSSTISQREANEAPIENVQFPNIMLCTDSIHSKYKLRKMYPQVNDTLIQQFYGLDVDPTALVICSFFSKFLLLNFRIYGRSKQNCPLFINWHDRGWNGIIIMWMTLIWKNCIRRRGLIITLPNVNYKKSTGM